MKSKTKEWVILEDKGFLTTTYLTPMEKELYRCLVFHARDKNTCFPSQETIGIFIQKGKRRVAEILHDLVEKRVLTWKSGMVDISNQYTVWTYDPGWTIFDESKLAPKALVREQLQRSKNIGNSIKSRKFKSNNIIRFKKKG